MTRAQKQFALTGTCLCVTGGLLLLFMDRQGGSLPVAEPDFPPTVIDEIMSVGAFYRGPEVNQDCSDIAFTRSGEGGRRLYFLNTATGEENLCTNTNEILRFVGYSSNDTYFAFKALVRGAEVLLVSRKDAPPIRVEHHRGLANDAVWVTSNSICFSYSQNERKILYLTTFSAEGQATEELDTEGAATSLVVMGPRKIAFVRDLDIWTADFDTRQCAQYSHLGSAGFGDQTKWPQSLNTALEWLKYSAETDEFLFCAGDESNWRHVFRFKKAGDVETLKQVTFNTEHSYNGRWIQGGKGFAFIGNLTNRFYLAIRPKEADAATNLFYGGDVEGYCTSKDGERIFAIASLGAEPAGTWEYDLLTRQLHYLGGRAHLSFARIIPRQERWVRSFDGLQVAYYFMEPKDLDKSKKYPAIISVPPEGNQFYRAWEKYSQLFANMGVFDVSVNHRAIDGYGNLYKRQNADDSYKDVMAVYNQLKRNRNIDRHRIFLRSTSSGERVVEKLLSEFPELWAGVIIVSGSPPPKNLDALKKTKLFLFVGKRDSLFKANQEFEKWGREAGVPIQALYAPRTGHGITDVGIDKQFGHALAEFIFPSNSKGNPRPRAADPLKQQTSRPD